MFRVRATAVEVLIGHMGGPFWARKDEGAWSFPKGGLEAGEDALTAARREFEEETGLPAPAGAATDMGVQRQRSGKTVRLFAVEADPDLSGFSPGTFTMTRGGRQFEVPEIDRIVWAGTDDARRLLTSGQVTFLDRLPLGSTIAPPSSD